MVDYTNRILENYLLGKELKSSILVQNTDPTIDLTKKLDVVLKSILRNKHQINEINLDNIL